MTQTLYRYRPASLWALVRLVIADDADQRIARETRDALFVAFKIERKSDVQQAAVEALESVETMLTMFG